MTTNETPLFAVPGLDTPSNGKGKLETAVTALTAELQDAGQLVGKHAATMITLEQTALAIDREMSRGKVSVAISNMTRMLLDGLESLPDPQIQTGDDYDALDEIIKTMTTDALTGTDD